MERATSKKTKEPPKRATHKWKVPKPPPVGEHIKKDPLQYREAYQKRKLRTC
jgi:hypothetical protein